MDKLDRWEFLLQRWGYENGPPPGSYWSRVERVLKKMRKQKQKSIDDIKQELNEKFDQIEKNYKEKCILSKARADREFERFCKQQNQDFEIAKTTGRFPQKINYSAVLVSSGSGVTWQITSNFGLNKTNNSKGYWLIKPELRVYSEKKPNVIIRRFVKLFDLEWVND
jgi:restriction endonuclease Mrr